MVTKAISLNMVTPDAVFKHHVNSELTNLLNNINNLELADFKQYLKVIGKQYLVFWVEKVKDEEVSDITMIAQLFHSLNELLSSELGKRLKTSENCGLFRPVNFQLTAKVFYGGLDQYVLATMFQSGSFQHNLTPEQFLDNLVLMISHGIELN